MSVCSGYDRERNDVGEPSQFLEMLRADEARDVSLGMLGNAFEDDTEHDALYEGMTFCLAGRLDCSADGTRGSHHLTTLFDTRHDEPCRRMLTLSSR